MNEIANNKVNLCDSCSQAYPDCTSKPENVYFGDGIGHDNICACSEYQPSAQPQRMKGKWDARGWNNAYWKCSNCDELTVFPFNFCPFCGSDMRGEDDE